MSIINFSIPSDAVILEDIKNAEVDFQFIGSACVRQNIRETVFTRLIKFENEKVVKKVIYKKKGVSWGFESLELVNF
jgi:hypothetical protein